MRQILSHLVNKWILGYAVIIAIGLGLLFIVHVQNFNESRTAFIKAESHAAAPAANDVEQFEDLSDAFIMLLVMLMSVAWASQQRRFGSITKASEMLESRVLARTNELEHAMQLVELLKTVTVAANEASSVQEGFQAAVDAICAYTGWPVGHAYIFSTEKNKLVSMDVWHLADAQQYAEFRAASDALELAPNEGFLGDVVADSTPVWIMDVADSDVFTRNEVAAQAGLKAAFGFPVFIGRKAVAVLEFYTHSNVVPDDSLLNGMANIGKQLGQTIERAQAEAELKQSMQHIKLANQKMEAITRDLQASLARAEAANIAKSDFLANMSHELRTPMNGVLGMAYLLADTPLNDDQRQLVSTINGSAESLLMLLNDILDFSKIEAGALELEHIPFGLTDMLHQTTTLLRVQAEKKHLELLVDLESGVPEAMWGDSGRIRQILTNLIGNAIKFTETGHVRLAAGMRDEFSGPMLHIAIEDTGMGIPEEKLGEIFEKFTQADNSITRKFGGTGLGLAITKQLVTMMGGTIGVDSALGKGSTFWFNLPCTPADSSLLTTSRDERSLSNHIVQERIPIHEARILLVEDYPVNQVFAEKILRKFGVQHFDVAENGLDAIEHMRATVYDMIFMDCQMPVLDGYQATVELRMVESGSPRHIPIIAMTANAMVGDREKCLNAGMDDYLSKPLRADHLKKILQVWFVLDESTANTSLPQPTANASAHLAVDLEQLRLFTNGDLAEEKALAELFLEQADSLLQSLKQSLQTDDAEEWKSAAHRLKGSAGNLGASALHECCRQAELHWEEDLIHKREMLALMDIETNRVREFFAAY